MSGTHKLLSPSSAKRRILCAGSLAASSPGPGVPPPESPSSYDASSGTASHSMGEQCLSNGWDPDCFEGETVIADDVKFKVDSERIERVRTYVDTVRKIPGELRVEVKLDTSSVVGVPEQGGTGDAVVLDYAHDTIHAGDFKDGQGLVRVWDGAHRHDGHVLDGWSFEQLNAQLGEYGAAALSLYELTHEWKFVHLFISQPRINWYDEVTLTVEQLRAWVEWLKPKEQRAYQLWLTGVVDPAKDLTPSEEACKWCPVKACPARDRKVLEMFPLSPVEAAAPALSSRPINTLTDDELAFCLDRADFIEGCLKDWRAEGLARGMAGRKLKGWKCVTGRQGARMFSDKEKVALDLQSGITIAQENGPPTHIAGVNKEEYAALCMTQPELLTLPAMERTRLKTKYKTLWAAIVAKYMTQAAGGYSLVRDFDQRPALTPNAVAFPIAAEPVSEFGSVQSTTEGLV